MKRNLLKTLLVAVGLVMGVNAWAADVTTIYERGTTTDWSDTDITNWSGTNATVTVNNGLAFSAGNTKYEYKKDVTTTENSLLKLTATWNTGSSTGRAGGYNYIAFGDIEFRAYGQDPKGTISIAGTETTITTTKTDVRDGAVWNIEVTINKATKEVNYSITLPNNNKKTGTGLTNGVYDALKIGFFKPGRVSSTNQTLVNIELTETKQEIQTANYTVKFTDEENNEIKTADIRNGAVGDAVNITEADKQSFKTSDGNKKYIYESDDAENKTIAEDGSTIVTIKFREAKTYHYTVYAVVAGNKKQIDEGWEWEGETMYVNYPRYLEQDGTLYYIEKNQSGGYFQKSFTLTQDNQEETINYTAGSKGVVYLAEAEKINGLSYSSAVNSDIRCSNGSCAYNAGENDVVITNLPAGKYKLYTSAWGAAGTEFVFKAGDNKIKSTYKCLEKEEPVPGSDGLFTSKGYIIDYESEEITLLSETAITLGATTDGSRGIDFIYIIKTGDATETVTVTDAGLATYCPTVGLDFTNAENIAAYKASVNGNEVTLTKVTTVAKGEGVLLRSINGGAAEENIDMTVNETKDESNAFVGTLEDITVYETAGDKTNYVLSKENDVMGFYKAKAEANGGTKVAAGKAYLPVLTSDAAKGIKVVFDGETTGISTVKDNTAKDNTIYNLNGQRVAAPAKGLYIMNGKKVVIK